MTGPSAESCAVVAAAMGEALARRPDLTPADMGEHLARIMGEMAGVDADQIAEAVATARARFAPLRRDVLVGMARRPTGRIGR